ncbi:MAG: hypothetical protein A2Y97_00040 [Nitrospirae bacterium RBG_13_39_12]|nr:MAG: hypothetical protein A2Y97_00040 [Nitrospirae bacterium RBG_13_39_12]
MITSNTCYPFGGKVATVETPSFKCMISTAKEGVFKKQSVVFLDINMGMANRRPVAKLHYNDILTKEQRLQFHDIIVSVIDESGMNGLSLYDTLRDLFQGLRKEGIGSGFFTDTH